MTFGSERAVTDTYIQTCVHVCVTSTHAPVPACTHTAHARTHMKTCSAAPSTQHPRERGAPHALRASPPPPPGSMSRLLGPGAGLSGRGRTQPGDTCSTFAYPPDTLLFSGRPFWAAGPRPQLQRLSEGRRFFHHRQSLGRGLTT